MDSDFNYQVIELTVNGCPTLQTIGLYDIIGVDFCMQLVIDKALARGLITQIVKHYLPLIDQPTLFSDPWIHYIFKENHTLCLLPFVLLRENDFCHIILPDLDGLYPWHTDCKSPFNEQVDESLMVNNMLIAIKALYLTRLIIGVSQSVYRNLGFNINLDSIPLEELPDYLAEVNLDLYIVLNLCFAQIMPDLNQFIIFSCQSLCIDLMNLSSPLTTAHEITQLIYDSTLVEKYAALIVHNFYKLYK